LPASCAPIEPGDAYHLLCLLEAKGPVNETLRKNLIALVNGGNSLYTVDGISLSYTFFDHCNGVYDRLAAESLVLGPHIQQAMGSDPVAHGVPRGREQLRMREEKDPTIRWFVLPKFAEYFDS
jgi:hypothetical protein